MLCRPAQADAVKIEMMRKVLRKEVVTGLISSMWTYIESFSRIAMVGEDSFEMYLR